MTRPECGLCEEYAAGLAQLATEIPLPPLRQVDIDDHPDLARRHGLDIPVLLWDGVRVGQHPFDRQELLRLLRPR